MYVLHLYNCCTAKLVEDPCHQSQVYSHSFFITSILQYPRQIIGDGAPLFKAACKILKILLLSFVLRSHLEANHQKLTFEFVGFELLFQLQQIK